MDPKATRGYFNNNPGNMDRSTPPWDGEIRDPTDPRLLNGAPKDTPFPDKAIAVRKDELLHGRFCVFGDAPHGVRAMAKNLRAYRDRLGLRTVRGFINRWAPPNENNTEAYIRRVCDTIGARPDQPVDIERRDVMRALVIAIICVECAGNPYDAATIEQGLTMAGVAP